MKGSECEDWEKKVRVWRKSTYELKHDKWTHIGHLLHHHAIIAT